MHRRYSADMTLSRREFLRGAAGLAAAAVPWPRLLAQPRFRSDPFVLGVASGYPSGDGVVLWTRLAPEPLAGGGLPQAAIKVGWEIATDEAFRDIVRKGAETAVPQWGHSVHAEIAGLEPARHYFYRFHAGGAVSAVGRTRTAPAPGAALERLRFVYASCQHYEQGWYSAYRHMAAEDLDLVIHLGDYIYESSWGRNHVRKHDTGLEEPITLEEYRNRYALYKSDPDLRAAHAAFPWLVTWDDHEVDNDYAADRSQDRDLPAAFLRRRAAAYQAYYEHMPLPKRMRPTGPDMRIYARADFGALARIHVLDDRQYRSQQACPRPGRGGSNVVRSADCPELLDPARTMLGAAQESWLDEGIARSTSRWNVIAQQTIMSQVDRAPGPGQSFWTDGWDGYPVARARLLKSIAQARAANPVVIGGDVHMFVVADVKADYDDPKAPVVATEFTGTSITSQGLSPKVLETWRNENSHIKFANSTLRGYTAIELSASRCTARLRTVKSVADRDSPVATLATFVVEDGRPGAQREG
jgi:alkaline phosphatase D